MVACMICVDVLVGVGGFLPAVKQIANVAALPGIVGVIVNYVAMCQLDQILCLYWTNELACTMEGQGAKQQPAYRALYLQAICTQTSFALPPWPEVKTTHI